MPFMFLAMYSYWWKAALKPKDESLAVIVMLPEDEAPELSVKAPAVTSYEG